MPMISPISDTSTDSSRPAPVSGKPKSTSSMAEAIERPGSIATMPPATMNAKSCSAIGTPERHGRRVDGPREQGGHQGVDRVGVELGQRRSARSSRLTPVTTSTTSTVARAANAVAPIITATAEASSALATETAATGKMRGLA